ncbi:MAG TPA: 4-hydroxy-tetrahydrodipicolinate reductase, partial [Hyphomicrobiaceae bacterium]|nr:4-hydroxy-tetrahydrodipicolinate reductase [Hyphomicrobiaceae bacterium]
MADLAIGVMGVGGRMGRELARAVHNAGGCKIAGGIEPAGSPAAGQDIGQLIGVGDIGAAVTTDALELIARVDAILDFTTPAASVEFAGLAANARIIHVIGTTGCTDADDAKIAAAARHATIIKAGNMSLGVNL